MTDLSFGTALGEYNVLKKSANAFASQDTIYAVVITDGNGPPATLRLLLKDSGGNLVYDRSESIALNGSAATPFKLTADHPLSAGAYSGELTLDGHPAAQGSFEIRD